MRHPIKVGDVYKVHYSSFYCLGVVTEVREDGVYFTGSEIRLDHQHHFEAVDTNEAYRWDQVGLTWLVGTDVENNLEKIPTGS